MNVRKALLVSVVGLVCLIIPLTEIQAEGNGALKINNQVIYEENKQKMNTETNFALPDLFLPTKTEREKQRQTQEATVVKKVQKETFMVTGKMKEPEMNKKVSTYLFKQLDTEYTPPISRMSEHIKTTNKFWFYGGIVLAGSVLLGLGLLLGNYFSYHRAPKSH